MTDGIDDFDDVIENVNDTQEQTASNNSDDELISAVLRDQGIEDLSKIKFEDDMGNIEERPWNQLSIEEKYNILSSGNQNPDYDLDDEETQLLNSIRLSNLTPSEYIQNLSRQSIQNYIANNQAQTQSFSVDQYSDDELFLTDLLTKTENITDEEALDILSKSKDNPSLYQKQINSLREEYKQAEIDQIQQQQYQQQQYQQQIYNKYSDDVSNAIMNLKEVSGYDINLDDDEKSELHEFLTGFDNAGNSWLGKALNDPNTLVKLGYYALNGDRMIEEISSYYNNEIAQVRQNSYKKGYEDAKKESQVVYKPIDQNVDSGDDLDDF